MSDDNERILQHMDTLTDKLHELALVIERLVTTQEQNSKALDDHRDDFREHKDSDAERYEKLRAQVENNFVELSKQKHTWQILAAIALVLLSAIIGWVLPLKDNTNANQRVDESMRVQAENMQAQTEFVKQILENMGKAKE